MLGPHQARCRRWVTEVEKEADQVAFIVVDAAVTSLGKAEVVTAVLLWSAAALEGVRRWWLDARCRCIGYEA